MGSDGSSNRSSVRFIEGGAGYLACGDVGRGRLADPAVIVRETLALLAERVGHSSASEIWWMGSDGSSNRSTATFSWVSARPLVARLSLDPAANAAKEAERMTHMGRYHGHGDVVDQHVAGEVQEHDAVLHLSDGVGVDHALGQEAVRGRRDSGQDLGRHWSGGHRQAGGAVRRGAGRPSGEMLFRQ